MATRAFGYFLIGLKAPKGMLCHFQTALVVPMPIKRGHFANAVVFKMPISGVNPWLCGEQ